ncbi:MAG: VWA domain-containing protein [Candidatus Kapabacteria bacterium]|nr:VWA domain-containing protein [Candidatus Kapabacteria bacterium]MCX7937633.1 VWA domain-containing protein [Chlorobiota bacterium]
MAHEDHLRSQRALIEEEPLFAEFELAGLIGTELAARLPEHLWVVFAIARVIASSQTALGQRLAPLLARTDQREQETAPPLPTVAAEEYEADLIRHFHELPLIYPYQFLLPEEVFYQRLAERSLWLPRPVPPRLYRFPTASDTFAPDPRKQKVYVLFDVSRSMNTRWRIALAKAIAYVFLERNLQELGTIYFRTFAEHVGARLSAEDVPSYRQLLRMLLLLEAHGRGTNLQEAIETAIEDIQQHQSLSDAEILVITDGAAHLDIERLREKMGTSIRLHAVKIGHERIVPDPAMVEYYARKLGTPDARRLLELQERRRQLEHQLQLASTTARRSMLAHDIGVLDRLIGELAHKVAHYATEHFGSDIEQLSEVFVELDDIDPAVIFQLSVEQRAWLERIARALLEEFEQFHRNDDAERMAALVEYLRQLLRYNPDAERLHTLVQQMEQALRTYIQKVRAADYATIEVPPTAAMLEHVRFALGRGGRHRLSLVMLMRIVWRRFVRWLRRQRQVRIARVLVQRRWRRR